MDWLKSRWPRDDSWTFPPASSHSKKVILLFLSHPVEKIISNNIKEISILYNVISINKFDDIIKFALFQLDITLYIRNRLFSDISGSLMLGFGLS